jgi:DNA-binding CsgD family transcriptional regulator
MQTYRLAFQARRPFRMEYRLQRADGAYRWVVDSGNPWFDSNGGFLGYIGCGLDITDLRGERPGARIRLTGREREVLTLIAQGKTTKEVGRQLGITYKTADSHRSNIMEKLEAHGTAALVRYAIRIGLVDP